MHGYIGNTDFEWYRFLASQPGIDEVNFWQPSGGRGFRVLQPGEPFFFRLKAPHNAIAGFGYFASFSVLPAWLAWESFRLKNGARDFAEMRDRIEFYRRRNASVAPERPGDYLIGCIMVASPVFFSQELWVREPSDWARNIVSGKGVDLASGEGLRIFTECLERAAGAASPTLLTTAESTARYGEPTLVAPRLGQGIFRVSVLDAYDRACAVTREHSLPVLEAAHIKPYADGGEHAIRNGLLLRSDIHKLFDLGYVTVTPEYRFAISDALYEDFNNGRTYYAEAGKQVYVPAAEELRPERELLEWHGETVWRG